jgi:cellulose synthase/poly-beta-1,6-N-acetylglucosamine synthase-like glycosyltransferase
MTTVVVVLRWTVALLLIVLFARRVLVLVASMLPRRATTPDDRQSLVLLVPARNEAQHLPRLLEAIDALEYPAERVEVVLVSDGSTDATDELMRAWKSRFATSVCVLPTSAGKGGALAAALAVARPSELVVVLDADCVPEPDVLRVLAGAFADPSVGAAAGYPEPTNGDASVVARYAALERWVHHLVWLAGKDALRLNPSVIGVAFALRRVALEQAGGFPVGRMAEDIDLSASLIAAGWRLRWIGEAVVREDVVETRAGFSAQRTRWTRGLLQGARGAGSLEELFVSLGYLDRVVLVAALALAAAKLLPLWWPLGYLLAPFFSVLWALHRAGVRDKWKYLLAAGLMVAADVVTTLRALWAQLLGTTTRWGNRA